MEPADIEAALRRHDRRRGRAILMLTLALLTAAGFYGGVYTWISGKQSLAVLAAEQARQSAEAARLQAINQVDARNAELVWARIRAERADELAERIQTLEEDLPEWRARLARVRANEHSSPEYVEELVAIVDKMERRLAEHRAAQAKAQE